jgi:superoxide dismutase, Cu-Zn family
VKRITKGALGGLAGCALALGATQWAAGASELARYEFARRLIDVQAVSGPFDRAKAQLRITETSSGSTLPLRVSGINPAAAATDHPFGAHLHTGLCVKGDMGGMKAGPHYQHVPLGPLGVNRENEVWFDLVPNVDGTAIDETYIPFKVEPGVEKERAVVIHVDKTNETTGAAGARQACLPVDYEDLQ